MNYLVQPNSPRAQLEACLASSHLLLCRFEDLQEQKNAIDQRYAHHYVAYKSKWRAGGYWLCALIGTVFLSIVAFAVALAVMYETDITASNSIGVAVLFLLPLPVALIAAGIIVATRNTRVPTMNSRRERLNQEANERVVELARTEVAPVDHELHQARQEFHSHFDGNFPAKFLSSVDVGACWQIVHDHRASTVQEAINRYLTDQHEQCLRNAASAQLVEQQRATRVARMNGLINATVQGAVIGAVRSQRNNRS